MLFLVRNHRLLVYLFQLPLPLTCYLFEGQTDKICRQAYHVNALESLSLDKPCKFTAASNYLCEKCELSDLFLCLLCFWLWVHYVFNFFSRFDVGILFYWLIWLESFVILIYRDADMLILTIHKFLVGTSCVAWGRVRERRDVGYDSCIAYSMRLFGSSLLR